MGLLLPGANAVVSVAEQEVPSSIAALLIGSVPLWVILLRTATGDGVSPARRRPPCSSASPASRCSCARASSPGDATVLGLLACVGAALMWASGSFASPRLSLPRDPLVVGRLADAARRHRDHGRRAARSARRGDVDVEAFSARSLLALAYLIVFGSWVAYTAYAWLLQNAPISKVATYAYVNPVVAIVLGWLVLDEVVTSTTIVGAAIIVASVALVVRTESQRRR